MPLRKCTHSCVPHSLVTCLFGKVPLPLQAMRAVSTIEKLRERALAANAGMPGCFSHASTSAALTVLGCLSSRFFFR